jgi:hypothetical protein
MDINIKLMRYYIYAYVDLESPGNWEYDTSLGTIKFEHMPIYIGKGCGGRMEGHMEGSHNQRLDELIKRGNIEYFKINMLDNVTSHIAYRIESELIYLIGREDLGTGPLFNKSTGINLIESKNHAEITPLNLELNRLLYTIEILNKTKTIKEASRILGISERSIYRIKKDYNLEKVEGDWVQV